MTHILRVPWYVYDKIVSGDKTLEIRVADDWVLAIVPGEETVVADSQRQCPVDVTAIRRYGTFTEMLDQEDCSKIWPA